jgi:hypothetical protein
MRTSDIVLKIPVSGYGMGSSEYGEALMGLETELEFGVDYVVRLEKAAPPEPNNLSEEEIEEYFPADAVDLVLRRILERP